MKTTTNYGLKKPDGTDLVNIEDLNANADSIDTQLAAKEGLIKSVSDKSSLADTDTVPLSDSAASNVTKKITFANIKASLKTYFDTMYNKYTHPTTAGNKHIPSGGAANQVLKYGGASGTAAWGDAASGKKYATLVVGTSTSGHTAADVNYLCDGTDDQAEINAAIAALPSTGGKVVIREGTYNITARIILNKGNVTVEGMGNSTVLKRMWDSTISEGVIYASADYCTVKNVCVDGSKTNYAVSYNYGIFLYGCNNTITGNTCNNNSGNGIYLYSSSSNRVIGNTCNNNSSSGINMYGISSSINNIVTGNTCNNNSNNGIQLNGGGISNNTVTGNTCNGNSFGIYLYGINDNTVMGNACSNNSSYGIYLIGSSNTTTGNACNNNSTGIYLFTVGRNTVTGNTCNNNSSNGIHLIGSSNTITGNTCICGTGISSDYTSSQYTIRLSSNTENNLVAANNVMGKAVTDEGTNNTVVDNKSS